MQKSKRILDLFVLALVCVFIMGCGEDFLDRQPLDQVVSSNFYQTEEDAQKALVAVYDALQYQSSPGVSWSPFVTVADILSDDALGGGADANDGLDENQLNGFNIPTTNLVVHSLWLKNYVGIYRANLLLEKIEGIDADDAFKARVIAECKFLRAYFYFELVRFFENVPLLTATIKGPSEYAQDQESPQEVYSQIATDLIDAANDLPTEVAPNQNGRVTTWAAKALLGRVYLFYNGVYGEDINSGNNSVTTTGTTVNRAFALAYLEDVIDNSNHFLLDDYNQLFRLGSEFSAESVFEISHGDSPAWWDWGYLRGGEGNLASQMQGPRVTGSTNWNRGWSFAPVSKSLVEALSGDPRIDGIVLSEDDIDGNLIKGFQHTGYFSRKYSSDAEHWGSDGQFEHNRTTNYRIIRFADVLLMAAELGSVNAKSYFDQVRARVGLPSIPLTMDNLFEERRKEFALEGIRYFDVLRRGMDYATSVLTSVGERGPKYEGDQIIFDVTFKPETRGFLPIPQTEIDLSNGLFVQNQGY